jgi:LDH2 family malate/lactate/ureidoglycolate dehydrogenase
LSALSQAIFTTWGAPPVEAALVAELLVDANLTGHDSHGVAQIPGYLEAYAAGLIVPGAVSSHERETPATALLDGHWGFGQRLASEATRLAIEKARRCGVSSVAAYHCHHIGRLGAYTQLAADAGMLGIMAVNDGGGGQRVVPYGGIAGRLSTNPLSVGLPTGTSAPLILDISTSVVAEGQVRLKRSGGERMPLGWMLDALGHPTTDPEDFFPPRQGNLLPLGGEASHKGYGLAVMVHILGGALAGASFSPIRNRTQKPSDPHNIGHFFMAIDPRAFRPDGLFEEDLDQVVDVLHNARPADPAQPVLVAGDPEMATRRERLQHGVPIPDDLMEQLRAVAKSAGVPFVLAP